MNVKKSSVQTLAVLLILLTSVVALAQPGLAQAHALVEQGVFGFCRKPHVAGTTEYVIESGGLERRFLLHVPASYDGLHKIPVVLDLHGSTSFPEQELAISGMDILADAEGFAVVAPEGLDTFWNVPVDPTKQDDVQFISDVIDAVDEVLCMSKSRVYATGFSGGGRMVSQLACDLSDRIAAIAPVGGLRSPTPCEDEVPVITFHGTADPINPYEGGGQDYWQTGVQHAVQGWVERNGCRVTPYEREISGSVTKARYVGCDYGGAVELYTIEGMGHQWPGSVVDIGSDKFGSPNNEIDASQLIWHFFERQRLR